VYAVELVGVLVVVLCDPEDRQRESGGADDRAVVRLLIARHRIALVLATVPAKSHVLRRERGSPVGIVSVTDADVFSVHVDAGVLIGHGDLRSARAGGEHGGASKNDPCFHWVPPRFGRGGVYTLGSNSPPDAFGRQRRPVLRSAHARDLRGISNACADASHRFMPCRSPFSPPP